MMKLILSLTLIWMLSSTGGALQCQNDQTKSCESNEHCAKVAIQGCSEKQQSCVPSSACNQTFSYNFGLYNLTAFVHCSCDSENVTYPGVQTNKSLQCFSCEDGQSTVCDKTVQCEGVQDRCSRGSVGVWNKTIQVFGCISRNLCDAASELNDLPFLSYFNFTSGPECCAANLCNSAPTVTLNVVPFLLGLIMRIVY